MQFFVLESEIFDLRLHRAEDRLHLLHLLPILKDAVNLISVPAQVHCCPRTRVHEDSSKSWIDREVTKLRDFFGSCSVELWLFTDSFASSMGLWVNVGYSDPLHNVATHFSVLDLTELCFSQSEFRDKCTSDFSWLATCSGFLPACTHRAFTLHLIQRTNLLSENCERKDSARVAILQHCAIHPRAALEGFSSIRQIANGKTSNGSSTRLFDPFR